MNKLILFEIVLFASVLTGSLFGILSLQRAGQVFLAIGIIDLIMSIAALRNWPMLRGDISNIAPLSKRDSDETPRNQYSSDHDRPSTGFVIMAAVTGIIAIAIGAILIFISL